MNKPLSRRLFGKAMAALPMAAQQAAKTLAIDAAAVKAAGELASVGASVAGAAVPMPYGFGYALQDPAMMALWKAGLAPEWLIDDIDRQINEHGRHLAPDVVTLRSVSTTAKIAINQRRMREQFMRQIERKSLSDAARDAFWQKKHAQQQ